MYIYIYIYDAVLKIMHRAYIHISHKRFFPKKKEKQNKTDHPCLSPKARRHPSETQTHQKKKGKIKQLTLASLQKRGGPPDSDTPPKCTASDDFASPDSCVQGTKGGKSGKDGGREASDILQHLQQGLYYILYYRHQTSCSTYSKAQAQDKQPKNL